MEPEPQLPSDPRVLRQMVLELLSTVSEQSRQIGQLSSQLEALKRRLFGPTSEKIDPNQLVLDLGSLAVAPPDEESSQVAVTEPEGEDVPDARRKGHGRRRLPTALVRQRTEYHPAPDSLVCGECTGSLERIGEEVSEQLEYVPSSLFVREHARIKYACPHCQGNVVIGTLPIKPIEKGVPGPGLLAHVVTSKYADHLPLHRLEGIFLRQGVELSRSTLCDWVTASAKLLEPIVKVMKSELLGSRKIHTDDTPVPVLEKDRKATKKGRLWIYIGDAEHEHIVFDYTPDRTRDGPKSWLEGYSGYLQADAYSGYDAIYAGDQVVEVACWAHARRKFFDSKPSARALADAALGHIRELYRVERRARDLEPGERRDLRLREARPILDLLKEWLDLQALTALPKSPLGSAVGYALAQWKALERYLEDGMLEIDNNRAERALRRVAIGRKNWMFAGSDEGGRRAAILYSLIASCAAHKLDPYAYLRDVLERLTATSPPDLAALTPKAWKAALLEAQAA